MLHHVMVRAPFAPPMPKECRVAAYRIQEVRADIKLLYQQHSYTIHFATGHAKFTEITTSTSDAAVGSICHQYGRSFTLGRSSS